MCFYACGFTEYVEQERLAVLQNSDAEDLLELLHERDAELLQLRKAIELKDEQVARLTRSCKELYVHRKALQVLQCERNV
jgi:hypothetical protein